MSEAHLITAGFGIAAAPSQSAYRSPLSPFFLDSLSTSDSPESYSTDCTCTPVSGTAKRHDALQALGSKGFGSIWRVKPDGWVTAPATMDSPSGATATKSKLQSVLPHLQTMLEGWNRTFVNASRKM